MISLIFGLPGSGKTTFLAALAAKAQRGKALRCGRIWLQDRDSRDYKHIYSNTPIQGCCVIQPDMIGIYSFRDSLILLDESVLIADSRDYKTIDKALMMWFKQHRKYGSDVVLASQGYQDNDKRIRDVAANTYYVKKRSFGRSTMYSVSKEWKIDKTIEERYALGGFFEQWTIRRKKYYPLFDTGYIHGKPLPDLENPRKWSE